MRLGVIDVGSTTVHLPVVDSHSDGHPLPAYSHKVLLRLSENIESDGNISDAFTKRLATFLTDCVEIAEEQGVSDLMGFATSAIREAPNGEQVLARAGADSGVELAVLSGRDEARLTYLAVRRWFGWSSGRSWSSTSAVVRWSWRPVSTRIRTRRSASPSVLAAPPAPLPDDPPTAKQVKSTRALVRADVGGVVRDLLRFGPPNRAVGTSKTMRSQHRTRRQERMSPMGAAIGLSTSSVYPGNAATAFELAARLGYDGVEVMVWTDRVTQDAQLLLGLSRHYGIPILSVHAPTLLMTQRVWGPAPWAKVDRSIELAYEVGADTVVVHPPFRWQREYAVGFGDGIALREDDTGMRIAVENMYPWRARGRELQAYLPHWDPVPMDYDHVTLDLSHTATSGTDALEMADALGERLVHVHLADGSGSVRDEHLIPGRGSQPCDELLRRLSVDHFAGHVIIEVSTRKRSEADRETDLAEALAFAHLHLG